MLVRLTLVLFSSTTHSSVNHSSTCKQSLQAQQVLTLATVIRIKLLMPVLVMLVHTMTHPRKPLHLLTKLDTTLRLEWILLASTRTPGSLKLLPTHTQSNIGSYNIACEVYWPNKSCSAIYNNLITAAANYC